ncbi:Alpha/Beta hydrolase protein [Apiospora arundinis]|uniref:Carboxylic ester hydrolase n=1 Tax=Apiospora arundinis TaxID=335852 RepID=A0ABR2HSB7_9PEZI
MKFFIQNAAIALGLFNSLVTSSPVTPRAATAGPQSTLQQITDLYPDPSGKAKMYVYVPEKLAPKPPVIVAVHFCTGTAKAYFTGSPYAQLADEKGFVVVYPESPHEGTCWDVSSRESLSHNGGSDSASIASMVDYALKKYNGDASKVFVTGSSSGAMMTNVMAATYPELFQAAIVYSGVAAGCFVSTAGLVDAWNSTCSQGQSHATADQWANVVHDMYPGYTGARPRMQIYHGSADAALLPPNYNETIKQWSGVFGLDADKPTSTQANYPLQGYTTTTWSAQLQGIYALGVGHTVPIRGDDDMAFFGL